MSEIAFRSTADGRFSFAEAGRADAPAIVFLHGIGGNARAFTSQLRYFGSDWRAIAWDMPGYGGSAPLAAVSIAALAEALSRFLDQLGVARPVLVGHSIGGMIVQQLVAERADAAGAIVLAQTSPAFGRPEGDWQRDFIAARLGPLDRGETMPGLAPGLVAELVGDDPDPEGLALARACMAAVPEASYRAMMRALMGFDLRDALPRLRRADPRARRREGHECAGADDGAHGRAHSGRRLCLPRRRRASCPDGAARAVQCRARGFSCHPTGVVPGGAKRRPRSHPAARGHGSRIAALRRPG